MGQKGQYGTVLDPPFVENSPKPSEPEPFYRRTVSGRQFWGWGGGPKPSPVMVWGNHGDKKQKGEKERNGRPQGRLQKTKGRGGTKPPPSRKWRRAPWGKKYTTR